MSTKIKTMNDLRKQMLEVFDKVKSKDMDLNVASELTKEVGKVIQSVRTQLEYHRLRKDKPEIDFLKCR